MPSPSKPAPTSSSTAAATAASLTTGTPWRVILAFSIPLLIGNIVQQLYQFADAMVVGRILGVNALAAVGATGSIVFLVMGFAWGLTSGFAIPTAQAFGAQDTRAVHRSVAVGTYLSAIVSVVLTVGGYVLSGPLLELLQTPPELLGMATTFARVTFLGAGTLMFFNFAAATIRAIGDSRTPLIFLIIACVLNVALVIAFVAGLGWGIAGAAAATVISQTVSVVLCFVYMRARIPVLRVSREDWRVTGGELAAHLRLGLPFGFQTSIIALGTIAVQVRLNDLGADAVAAYTTAARVDGLAVAILQSIGLAVSMFAAQNLGARRFDRIRLGIRQGMVVAIGSAVVLGVLIVLLGEMFVRAFVGSGADAVVGMSRSTLLVWGVLYWILGALFILRGALQGLGDTIVPMWTGVLELLARLFAAIVLGGMLGYQGVMWSAPLAWVFAVAVLLPAYLRVARKLADETFERPTVDTVTGTIPIIEPSTATGANPIIEPLTMTGSLPVLDSTTATGQIPLVGPALSTGAIPVVHHEGADGVAADGGAADGGAATGSVGAGGAPGAGAPGSLAALIADGDFDPGILEDPEPRHDDGEPRV